MKKTYLLSIWKKLPDILWAVTLVCLPMTSFPPFFELTGAIVAPLSAIPLLLLAVIWLLPYLFRRGAFPRESLPLVVFLLIALLAMGTGLFIDLPGFKGKLAFDQELRAGVTLLTGIGFYFLFAAYPQDEARLRKTLQWINVGGIVLVGWTLLQAYYMLRSADYPDWMRLAQDWLAVKPPYLQARGMRVSGLAYEASWLAHQMVMLYLPLWIAATLEKTSAFKIRLFHRITLENILLPIGIAEFFMTSPRIALVALVLILIFLFVKFNLTLHRRIMQKITNRSQVFGQKASPFFRAAISLGIGLLFLIGYLSVAGGAVYAASQRDWRLALLFRNPPSAKEIAGIVTLDENTLLRLGHRLAFMERVVYWVYGWNVFNDYPWLGVGPGNSGLLFQEKVPAIGWASFEIREVIYKLPGTPNIKSLWMRLLAETGLIGFSIFISWLYLLWRSCQASSHSSDPLIKKLALMGQLSMIALLAEGFSIDSFAMPYLWVTAGLISAVGVVYRRGPANLSSRSALASSVSSSLSPITR